MKILLILVLNLLFSWYFLHKLYNYLLKIKIYDHPNERSLHSTPKVRGGGLGILISFNIFIVCLLFFKIISLNICLSFLSGSVILGIVGWIDDKKGLPATVRLAVQIISIIVVLFLLRGFYNINMLNKLYNISILGIIIFIFYGVWLINLYNFMDGIDGLALSQLLIPTFFIFFVLGYYKHNEIAMISLIMILSSIFFYKYNWPPSKMFMGDVLSGFLGYFFVTLTLYFNNNLNISFFLIPVLLSVFIYDSTITLLKRLFKKEKIWIAHNDHYYQMFAKNYGHKKVTIAVIIINVILFIPGWYILKYQKYDVYITIITYLTLSITLWYFKRNLLKSLNAFST